MSISEVLAKKIDEVLELMLEGKLPKDIDDTLLEKLLSVFREGCWHSSENVCPKKVRYDVDSEKTAYLSNLLGKTNVSSFLEKATSSLEGQDVKINTSVETFALYLLGIFIEQPTIFLSEETQKLLFFLTGSFLSKTISTSSPSLHVAVLSCMTSIAQHYEGVSWLVKKGILDTAFSFFSGSTYYVRKSAVNFFTTVLVTWSTTSSFEDKKSVDDNVNSTISSFIESFIGNLQASNGSEKKHVVSECCVSVLRLAMEKSEVLHSLLCGNFHLSAKVVNALKCTLAENEPQESIIELLVESLTCSAPNNAVITEVLQVFLQHKFVSSIIVLLSSLLLRQNTIGKPIHKDQLIYVLWPIVTLAKVSVACAPSDEEFTKMLSQQMTDKSNCVKLIRMSLVALSKLVHLLEIETLSCIVNASVEVLHHTMTKEVQSSMQLNISGNKKVQVSTLQFFSAMIEEPVCQKLTKTINLQLMDSLISAVENPSSDSNVTTQALKLISRIMALGTHLCDDLPKDLKKRLAGMVQRKLLDIHWSVVDTSLEVVAQMVKGCRDDELWKEWICTLSIHTAVWDVAASSEAEGYVRATALRVLISLCLCPFMWEQLKSQRGADEDTIVSVLCKLSNDPDVFVQRESVSSLFKWMQASNMNVPSNNSTAIFKTLTNAVKYSLDWDTKLIALHAWQWVAEKELSCFSSPTQKSSVEETLLFLCDVGYGSSLLSALSDHDTTVQHEAAQTLFSLRQTLLDLGLDETSFHLKDATVSSPLDHHAATDSDSFQLDFPELGLHSSSQRERDAAIEDVLNLDTLGQISKVLRTAQDALADQECPSLISSLPSSPSGNKSSCPISTFWKNLWSDELECVLTVSNKSSDVYVNNPVALLDDIIAAKVDIVCSYSKEYQEADCY